MTLTKAQKLQLKRLTITIKTEWKKSVASLIEVGRCLHELKTLLTRNDFLVHIETQFSMNEMQAFRLISLHLKFHDKKSVIILSSRPSVLYLLASTLDLKKLDSLARGGKILIGSKYKTISQLTIADIHSMKEKISIEKKAFNVDEKQRDIDRAQNAHRRFATFLEEISDWAIDLRRYQKQKVELENKELLKKYLLETIECLEDLKLLLS